MARTIYGGDHPKLVAILVEARKAARLTQTELAQRIGRNQSHVSLIEMGQRRVDVIEFVRMAEALGRTPEDLMAELRRRMSAA